MGAAPLPALTPGLKQAAQPSLHQRIALGLLCAGALYRHGGAGGPWRSRAFPEQMVREATTKALALRGWAEIRRYRLPDGQERACAMLTAAGRTLYAGIGGAHAARRPAPPTAERLLHECEQALDEIASQEAALDAEQGRLNARLSQLAGAREALKTRMSDVRLTMAELGHRLHGDRLNG